MDDTAVPDREPENKRHQWAMTILSSPEFVIDLQAAPTNPHLFCTDCHVETSGRGYRACVWLETPNEGRSHSPFDAWRI